MTTGRPAEPAADQGPPTLSQSSVGTVRDGTFTAFPQPVGGPDRNAVYLDADGRWTAWTETTSTTLDEFDWKVFLHDAASDTTRLLGDSVLVSPDRSVPAVGETAPVVGDREVFWAATGPRADGGFDDLILAAPLDRAAPARRAVVGGYLPAADGRDLFYVSSARLDRNDAYAGRTPTRVPGRFEVRRVHDARTAVVDEGPLAADQTVTALAAHDGAIAYTVASPATVASTLVLLAADGTRTRVRMAHGGGSTSLRLTSAYLAWGSGSASGDAGQYVLDREDGRLLRLGEAPGLSRVYASPDGGRLGWTVVPQAPVAAGAPFPVQVVRWGCLRASGLSAPGSASMS